MSDLDFPCTLSMRTVALEGGCPREPVTNETKDILAVDSVQWSCIVLCDPNRCNLTQTVNASVLLCQAFLTEYVSIIFSDRKCSINRIFSKRYPLCYLSTRDCITCVRCYSIFMISHEDAATVLITFTPRNSTADILAASSDLKHGI